MSRHFILLLHLPERSGHSKTAGAELVVRRQLGRKARTVGSRISQQTWAKHIVQGLEDSSNMSRVTVFQSTAWGIYCISEGRRLNLFNSPSLYIKLCVCVCVCVCVCSITLSCPRLCDPMDCSPPGSSACGIFQARILEWVAIPFSRGSSPPRG